MFEGGGGVLMAPPVWKIGDRAPLLKLTSAIFRSIYVKKFYLTSYGGFFEKNFDDMWPLFLS